MEAAKQTVGVLAGQVKAALQTHSTSLTDSLRQGGLIPGPATTDGLIPDGFKPQTELGVSYDGCKVELGNFFRASQCQVAPAVFFQQEVGQKKVSILFLWLHPHRTPPIQKGIELKLRISCVLGR